MQAMWLNAQAVYKTSPQFSAMITGYLPPLALSPNQQFQQASSSLHFSYERKAVVKYQR
jgi:hypothetical protein